MLTKIDHLGIYEKLLWPESRNVDFDYINPRNGKPIHIKGKVLDVSRNIHANLLTLHFPENHKVELGLPDGITWDETTSTLMLEYGKGSDQGGFLDELGKAEWGESPDAALKRLSPKMTKVLKIHVI